MATHFNRSQKWISNRMRWRKRKQTAKRSCAEMNVTNATKSLDNLVFWMKCNPMIVFQVLSGIISLYFQAKATKQSSKNEADSLKMLKAHVDLDNKYKKTQREREMTQTEQITRLETAVSMGNTSNLRIELLLLEIIKALSTPADDDDPEAQQCDTLPLAFLN